MNRRQYKNEKPDNQLVSHMICSLLSLLLAFNILTKQI